MNPVHLSSFTSTPSTSSYTRPTANTRLSSALSRRSPDINKENIPRRSSPTVSDINNLEVSLPEQGRKGLTTGPTPTYAAISDFSSQQSTHPNSHPFPETNSKESLDWSMPTPPRSDSATATVIPGGSYSYTTSSSATGLTTTAADMRFVTDLIIIRHEN